MFIFRVVLFLMNRCRRRCLSTAVVAVVVVEKKNQYFLKLFIINGVRCSK